MVGGVGGGWGSRPRSAHATEVSTHFFDVQEVFGIEIDCSSLDGTVLVQSAAVAHVRLHCKRDWFGLEDKPTSERTLASLSDSTGASCLPVAAIDIEVRQEKKNDKMIQDVRMLQWRQWQ